VTERLYYADPCLRAFDTTVVEAREVDGHPAVVLAETAFYPTSGGQPHDTGMLNGVPVVDVFVDDDGRVVHVLSAQLPGERVHGEIDWPRRFDHMQQHTGQHILSQAYIEACGAETVSFHLGEDTSTIDLDLAPLEDELTARAEEIANRVVLEDRAVTARFVHAGELTELPLRKPPAVEGPIRIVTVASFDWSACGGTHVTATGQVGTIKVVRVERRKDESRVHFLCGWRALADHQRKQEVVQALTAHLTTSEDELLASIERLEEGTKQLYKELNAAQMALLEVEVGRWLEDAEVLGRQRVVRLSFGERDIALLREAARRLADHSGVVALLAAERPQPQFVFAAAEDVDADMGALMHAATAEVGGRGGGHPRFAQGGAPEGASVERALDAAEAALREGSRSAG
jgi:alanyl-tRNA synthetase